MKFHSFLSILIFLFSSSCLSAQNFRPENLRCEYRLVPLGIDQPKPRLSWIILSSQRGQKQTAYQVIVSSSRKKLDAGDLPIVEKMFLKALHRLKMPGA